VVGPIENKEHVVLVKCTVQQSVECTINRTQTHSSSWQVWWTYVLIGGKGWGVQAGPCHGDLEPDEHVVGLN